MRLSELGSQQLLDKIGTMVLGLDREGRIALINRKGAEILGGRSSELIGKDWISTFILPQDRAAIRDLFFQMLDGKLELAGYNENWIRTCGGEERLIAWHNSLVHDEQGYVTGILSTGEDITARRQAEEKLRFSRERFRRFVDHAADAFFVFGMDGRFVDVNQQACTSLGYTREELLGLTVSDIDTEFPKDHFTRVVEEMFTRGGPFVFQGRHRRKDGSTFPVEIKADFFQQDEDPLFIAVARDLSQRLFQQEQLEESRDLLQTIIDAIPDIISVQDPDGRWILANRYTLDLFGLASTDYKGKTTDQLLPFSQIPQPLLKRCQRRDEQAWNAEGPTRSEKEYLLPNGESRIFDVIKIPLFTREGRRRALVLTGRDITEKKKVEDEYRKLFDLSPLPYLSISINGQIQVVNQAVLDHFGYTRELVERRFVFDFIHPEERDIFIENYKKFIQTGMLSERDYRICKADGSEAVVQMAGTVIHDEKGQPAAVQCVVHDVTRQRTVEEKIRENEQRYRLLFERSPVGVMLYNQDLHIVDCNHRFADILGEKRDALVGFDMKDLQDTGILSPLYEALKGKMGWREGKYRTVVSGRSIIASIRSAPLFDATGKISGGIAIVEDVTRQKEMESERMRFMSAIEQASEAILITNVEPAIEYVNPAFEQVTGYSFEEVRGKNPSLLKSGRHDRAFYKKMWQQLVQGRVWRGRLINRRKDGTLFEEDVTITPMRNPEGMITNYVAVKRDISKEKALERQLYQAQKMEAIGTLAGGIAHDFNNILSAILGYAEMVSLQLGQESPVRQDVEQIIRAGNRAADLVQQILTFSRKEEEGLRPVKLQFIVKEALKLLRASLPTTIELQQEIDTGCGSVLAHPTRMHQVLINLCTNAKQAMGAEGGVLKVTLKEVGFSAPSEHPLPPALEPGRYIELGVCDTGPGIRADIIDKIFVPFFTTKEKGEGTGLGLSVVHGIVKSHDGEIVVSSEPGKGATFLIYLPVIEDEQPLETESDSQPLPGGEERLLLVDDDAQLLEIMSRTLRQLGYDVVATESSQEALRLITDSPEAFDLLITDMTMPHLTGMDLIRQVHRLRPDLPVILCTGYSELIDADEARNKGVAAFINKPVDNRIMTREIRRILECHE